MIGLGELGGAPAAWLDDPRLAIRVCAALAPALAEDPVAVGQLISAAEQLRVFDNAFSEPFAHPAYRLMLPPQFQDWPRRTLIRTVCERVTDFERLLRAAAAVDLRFGQSTAPEFGPYLPIAFPNGLPTGVDLSWHQEVFAQAIAGHDDLWDSTRRGVVDMLTAAGLPDKPGRVEHCPHADAARQPKTDDVRGSADHGTDRPAGDPPAAGVISRRETDT